MRLTREILLWMLLGAASSLFAAPLAPPSVPAAADKFIRYTDFEVGDAIVRWAHPGEGCDRGEVCFRLLGLDPSLQVLSLPSPPRPWLVMAQEQKDGAWILNDTRVKKVLEALWGQARAE